MMPQNAQKRWRFLFVAANKPNRGDQSIGFATPEPGLRPHQGEAQHALFAAAPRRGPT